MSVVAIQICWATYSRREPRDKGGLPLRKCQEIALSSLPWMAQTADRRSPDPPFPQGCSHGTNQDAQKKSDERHRLDLLRNLMAPLPAVLAQRAGSNRLGPVQLPPDVAAAPDALPRFALGLCGALGARKCQAADKSCPNSSHGSRRSGRGWAAGRAPGAVGWAARGPVLQQVSSTRLWPGQRGTGRLSRPVPRWPLDGWPTRRVLPSPLNPGHARPRTSAIVGIRGSNSAAFVSHLTHSGT
jgi:hypothetical protein